MGTYTRSHSFTSGEKPTEAQWNVDIDGLITLCNGQIDKANVDSSSTDGIVTMDEAQTVTGRKTFSGNLAAELTIDTTANAAGSVQDVLTLEWDPGDGANLTDNSSGISLLYKMPDDADNQDDFAALTCMVVSDATGSEEGEFSFRLIKAGTLTEIMTLAPTTGLTVGVNDTGYDVTFFGATAGKKVFWDESADTLYQTCTVDIDGTVTVGVDDTGYDVKFFGATSGQYVLWDESADELVLAGDSKLSFHDAAGGENIIASADGHLEVNAGTTLDMTAPTIDVNASTAVTVDTDTVTFASANSTDPLVTIKNTTNDANGARLRFVHDKGGAGADNDVAGLIEFYGDDDNQDNILFAKIEGIVADASNGDECGKLAFYVAENDGTNTAGLTITGSTTDGEVDVGIGAGTSSVTTVAGAMVLTTVAAAGTDTDKFLVLDSSGNVDYRTGTQVLSDIGGTSGGASLTGSTDNTIATVTGANALAGEANLTYDGTDFKATSSTASKPIVSIENTHADATAGYLKFIKDPGSGQGADADIVGTITFYGTDASNNAPEEFGRIESYVVEADHGSEAGGMKFYVSENDATATVGLHLAGQATADGEIDVTIGAGAASTATVAGNLVVTGATSFGDANITNVGDIALDTISSDAGTSIGITLGTDAGDDLLVGTDKLVVEGDTGNVGIGTTTPADALHIVGAAVIVGAGSTTSNAGMTVGLTIDQGANDDEILAFKSSSDIAHGSTDFMETNTFAAFKKYSGTEGGLEAQASVDSGTSCFHFRGFMHTPVTTQATNMRGCFHVHGSKKSGTGSGAPDNNSNIFCVEVDGAGVVYIVDENGDFFYDATGDGGAFDGYADAQMVRAVSNHTSDAATLIRSKWDDMVRYQKDDLVAAGIIGYCPPEDEAEGHRGLVNGAQLQRLHTGAIWQTHIEVQQMKEDFVEALDERDSKIALLEQRLNRLEN